MADVKYEKLDRIREDIRRDKDKLAKLQGQIKSKEAKLKEAEASQIIADVGAMNMSPEQLGEFLALIQSGDLNKLLKQNSKADEADKKEQESDDDFYDEEENTNDED